MFSRDFNEPTDRELQELIDSYEESLQQNVQPFFEESSYEVIVDFFMDRNEYHKARKAIDYAMSQYPFSSYFLTKKAEILIEEKDYAKALTLLDRAEIFDPQNVNIYLLRSDVYLWNQKHDLAIRMVKKAIQIADKEELDDLYLEIADIYEDWEKFEKVLIYLKKSLIENPHNQESLHRMWFCYEMIEDYNDSILFHTNLINEHPYNFLAWYNLAYAYSGLKQYDNARDAYDFVIAIKDKYEAAYLDCGDMLFRIEKYEDAISYFREALQIVKPRKETYFSIAECYEKLNDHRKARHYYKKATKVDPHFAEAFYRIGTNYDSENRSENAITSFERALKLSSDNIDYMAALADAYQQAELFEEATDIYYKILDKDKSNKSHWLSLSTVLFEQQKYEDAIEILNKAEAEFIDNSEILYIRSAYHFFMGHKRECFSDLELALSKNYDEHFILTKISATFADDPEVRTIIEQCKP